MSYAIIQTGGKQYKVKAGEILKIEKLEESKPATKIEFKEILAYGDDKTIEVGRYHSWVVHRDLPEELEATSIDSNGQIMSLRHKIYDVRGVQYHPESVLTPNGKQILENWVNS